jgi:hypothetical protein
LRLARPDGPACRLLISLERPLVNRPPLADNLDPSSQGRFSMSEYEVAILFNELFNSVLNAIETFMAALFAMLVTAHFVGARLNRGMSGTIIGLFTVFSALTIFLAFAVSRRIAGLILRFDDFLTEGLDLSWMYIVPGAAYVVPPLLLFLLATAYGATLVFFIQARRIE